MNCPQRAWDSGLQRFGPILVAVVAVLEGIMSLALLVLWP